MSITEIAKWGLSSSKFSDCDCPSSKIQRFGLYVEGVLNSLGKKYTPCNSGSIPKNKEDETDFISQVSSLRTSFTIDDAIKAANVIGCSPYDELSYIERKLKEALLKKPNTEEHRVYKNKINHAYQTLISFKKSYFFIN